MDEEEKGFGEDAELNDDLMEPLLEDDLDFSGIESEENEDEQFDKDH